MQKIVHVKTFGLRHLCSSKHNVRNETIFCFTESALNLQGISALVNNELKILLSTYREGSV